MEPYGLDLNDLDGCSFGRRVMLILHDSKENKLLFRDCRYDFSFLQGSACTIVHMEVMSVFDPYLSFFNQRTQYEAKRCLEKLAERAASISVATPLSKAAQLPDELKKLYQRSLRALQKIENGCFVTPTFSRILWNLAYRIWINIKAYRTWLARQSKVQFLVTELCC